MDSIRHRLVGLASSLLACQLAAMVAAPALLYRTPASAAADGRELLCGCKEQPGAECPMHKGKHQSSSSPSGTMRSCGDLGDQTAAILTLLTSGGGILQTSSQAIRPAANGVALVALNTPILNSDRPPTSPPPRS